MSESIWQEFSSKKACQGVKYILLMPVFSILEVGAIIWPKKKTVHMKLTPICFLFPIVLVCFPCVTKQQMLVQVVRVLL